MSPAAIVFLRDPLARQLAVAWISKPASRDEWLDAAAVPELQKQTASRLCDCLERNDICTDAGLDPLAVKYITTVETRELKQA